MTTLPEPNTVTETPSQESRSQERWFLGVAIILLLVAAFFRLWNLGTVPPGLSSDELINVQLSEQLREGHVAVIYDEVQPAREGVYYALLAVSTSILGKGAILWRLPSVWLTMLALAMTTRLMRRLFGVRVSLMVLGLMAVTFWAVWMGRTVQHVALMPLATTLTVYLFVRGFQADELTASSLWFTLGGLALGLAQYVHVTAWTLIVLFFVATAYYWLADRENFKRHRANILYAFSLTAVVSLPLIVFLIRHPGVREPVPLANQPGLLMEVPGRLARAFAALNLRGDMLPQHNIPGRPVLGPVIGALLVVGIGTALARIKRPSYGLTFLWLAVGLIPMAFLPQQPDFEYMAVILPVIFVFPAIGVRALFALIRQKLRGRVRWATATLITIMVITLIAGTSTWTYQDYFNEWPQLGDVRLNYQADLGVLAHYLDTSNDISPVSVCSTPISDTEDSFSLTNRELLNILMHRHDLPIRYFDCTQSLVLANGGESQRVIFPRGHYYDKLPGPLLRWMQYAEDENVPGIRPDVVMRLDVTDTLPDYLGRFTTNALAAWPPESSDRGLTNLPVPFGYNVTLLGYEIRNETINPGDWVELTTYWRMDGPPPASLMTFAHILGQPEVIVAQTDKLGVRPDTLQVRDLFLQYTLIKTPFGLSSGPYPISVGLYFPETGERLPAFENGEMRANRVFIRSIVVER